MKQLFSQAVLGGLVLSAVAVPASATAGEWCDAANQECVDDAIRDCGGQPNLAWYSFTCDDTSDPYGYGCSWGCRSNPNYCWDAEWDCVREAESMCHGGDYDLGFQCSEGEETSSCSPTCLSS